MACTSSCTIRPTGIPVQSATTLAIACSSTIDRQYLLGDEPNEGATAGAVLRISWQPVSGEPEPVIQRHPVTQSFGGVPVPLPPSGGLPQATINVMRTWVSEGALNN